ncbi:MAG TPA: fused MFS/spermidine synthase [Solirubrobacterales bacterium]
MIATGRDQRLLHVLVFVVGMASLGAEIAAARLMSPYFGASTIVWANTIAVVLVSLSAGYWLGGRLGDDHPHLRGLCALVGGAAILLALVPFAARPFLSVSVDALDEISAGAFVGSLVGVLALVAVPIVLLGACSPWAVRLATPDVGHSGRTAGRLYAISTAGSLVGTMSAALLLIPFVGTQRTFLVFALTLAVVAAAGLGWRYLTLPAVVGAVIAVPVGTVKADTEEGDRVIYETETRLQYARVVEESDGTRKLELNEGVAEHSLFRPGSYLTGNYWDGLVVLPFAGLDRAPSRVAILGNAAGTVARAYGHYFPASQIDAVEIDPELTQIGRRYFEMRAPHLAVHHEDARPWLRDSDGGYDVIILDAYRQPYIPFYLATREFFELARERLAPGGLVVVNVGHPEGSSELERVIGRTMGEAFPVVLRDPIEDENTLLIGGERGSGEQLRKAAAGLAPELQTIARIEANRLAPALDGGEVYTDDRAPVEWLVDRSILGYAAGE